MGMGIFAAVGVAVVLVVVILLAVGGGRAVPWVVGILALLALAGVGMFAFVAPAPPPAPVEVQANPRPTAPVSDPNADRVGVPGETGPGNGEGAPLRSVRGRVLVGAEGEEPAAGATVEVFGETSGFVPFATPLARGTTDEDGRFAVEGVPAKTARVRASMGDLAPATATLPEGTEEATIRLLPASWIEGRVVEEGTGAPVEGAQVSAGDAVGSTTGEDGAFRVEGVAVSSIVVVAGKEGYAPATEVVEVPAEGKAGLKLELTPATWIAGTVFGPDGTPAAGATVTVEQRRTMGFVGSITLSTDSAVSGEDGAYRVEGIATGKEVVVGAKTDASIAAEVKVGPLERGKPAEGVDLHLAPAGTVLVTVRDPSGAPVEGATVSVTPKEEGEEERTVGGAGFVASALVDRSRGGPETDARGLARVRPVAPGPVKVAARKQDWRRAETESVAEAGGETAVALVLDPGAAIHGRVVDASGAPVARAQVSAQRFGAGEMVHEARTTGEDGAFRIGGLDERALTLRVEAGGFVATSLNNVKATPDEVVVTLERAGVIVGTAVDPSGRPVPKMRVTHKRTDGGGSANPMDFGGFSRSMLGDAQEDPQGRFRVEGLAAGTYEVTVTTTGLAPGRVAGVVVEAGKETPVEVALPEGLTLRGVVVRKTDGGPVAGARATVPVEGLMGMMDYDMGDTSGIVGEEQAEQFQSFLSGTVRGSGVSGPDGRFEIPGLEAGTVALRVKAEGLAPATVKGVRVPPPAEVRVEMNAEGAIEGTVYDAAGVPRSGATVLLQQMPAFMRMTTTGEDGRYRVGGLPAGSYLYFVMKDRNAFGGGGTMSVKSETVKIEEGKTLRKDHRLDEGTRVVGRVTRAGKPVAGVMVMLMAGGGDPADPAAAAGGAGFAMGSTDGEGKFEIPGVAPGRYTLAVQGGMGGGGLGGSEPVQVSSGLREVRRDIELPTASLRGIVEDESGRPVSGAQVLAVHAGKSLSQVADIGSAVESMGGQAFTDDEGRFAMEGMKPGVYTVQVQASGYGTASVEGAVASEGGGEVRVVLERGREVTVRVVAHDGTSVSGAGIFLTDAQGRELSNLDMFDTVRTGADGKGVVRAPTGVVTFEAVARGHGPGRVEASVPAPGEVTVRLTRGAGIEATVVGPGGALLAGAAVTLLDGDGNPYRQRFSMENLADLMGGSTTGSEGTWSRADLPAGSYRVRATQEGRVGEEAVVLADGETKRVTVRIP